MNHADSARNALNRLQTENFDLLFVDIDFGVGNMNGLELLGEINRMGKQIYVVIISAHYKFDYVVKGMELRATRYIPKPLDNGDSEAKAMPCISKPLYREKINEAVQLYLNQANVKSIDLKVPDGVRRIALDRLLAIETAERNKVTVYTVDTLLPDVFCTLNQLYKLLPTNDEL